jgi:hypothetical protein
MFRSWTRVGPLATVIVQRCRPDPPQEQAWCSSQDRGRRQGKEFAGEHLLGLPANRTLTRVHSRECRRGGLGARTPRGNGRLRHPCRRPARPALLHHDEGTSGCNRRVSSSWRAGSPWQDCWHSSESIGVDAPDEILDAGKWPVFSVGRLSPPGHWKSRVEGRRDT